MKVSIGGYTFTSFSDAVSFAMRRYDMTRKKAEQYVKQLEIKQRDSNTVAKKQTASRINNAIEQSFKRLDSEVRREQRRMSKIKSKAVVNPYTYGTGGGTRGWWTEGGVDPARTKMVFQPLGARSIAESYKNLVGANSSTNAAPGTAPDFAAATGWEFNGSSHYLQVSMAPVKASPISILVLFKPLQLTSSDCKICITDNAVTAAEYWALYFRGATAGDPAWAVVEHSRIPVIKHYKGVCHIFVDESADQGMAESIVLNAKVQRPGVCNAVETLLVHEACAASFLPLMVSRLRSHRVEVRGCARCRALVPGLGEASEEDWYREYLDLIISLKIVSSRVVIACDEKAKHALPQKDHWNEAPLN